nr:MAG TPA: hypothetical protein [Caudoviricetes sp.]
MAFNVNNMLEVVIEFEVEKGGFMEFPCVEMCTLTELNMTESVKFHVPLLYLQLEDGIGFFTKFPFIDGCRIRITILINSKTFQRVEFRVFNHNTILTRMGQTVTIDAYLNCPKYWFTSSCAGYRGSTSQVIKQIAETCGFGTDCDSTQDSQLWMQGNMTYAEFVKYLTQRGFGGKGSYMMSGLTLSQSLVYKNVNKLPDSGVKVATFTQSEGFFLATDFSINSNSGLNNGGGGGYASLMRMQTTSETKDTTYKTIDVKKKESNVNIDIDLVSEVQRSKVLFSHFNPEQSANLWEGVYQNDRYSRLYTINCNMIINSPTPLTLLTPYTLSAYNAEGVVDTQNSGTYIVDTRCMIIRGNKYGERITACRMGVN